MEALERAQRRLTRMMHGSGDISFRERVDRFGLFSLECQKLRGKLEEVYTIMRALIG